MIDKTKVFYIDPMSSGNLALYDYGILNGIDENIEVSYLCSVKYNHKPLNNLKSYPIFKYHEKKGLAKIFSYTISLLKTLGLILRLKPNAIHIQWCKAPYIDYVFMKLVRLLSRKTKLIYTAHNVLPHAIKKGDRFIFRKLYNEVDSIITHTENSRKELIALCPSAKDKLNVIPHGLISYDVDETEVQKIKSNLVQKYNLKSKTIFLAIGHQHKSKGIDILLKCWNKVLGEDKNSVLIIAGTNTAYEDLCTSKNILTFSKYLSNEEFNAFIEIANVVVLPYRKISQSGVLLSAIEMEKPLIVSRVGGLSDPFDYGNIGWVFDINNILEFEDLLERINITELEQIENNKKEWMKVKKEYTWDTIQEKTMKLYQKASL